MKISKRRKLKLVLVVALLIILCIACNQFGTTFDDFIDFDDYFGNDVCRIPNLNPFHKSVQPYYSEEWTKDKKCKLKTFTHVKNDEIFLNLKDVQKARLCKIERIDDFKIDINSCENLLEKKNVDENEISLGQQHHEHVKLQLVIGNKSYEEFHANVLPPKIKPPEREEDELDILLIMFDSVSNANVQRHMKKTFQRLNDDPGTFIFQGHTIVGDGTTAQLCAFLTGVPEDVLPEARTGFPNATSVDQYPFIFKDFHEHDYVTMYSEDAPSVGTFQFRLKGWDKVPTDMYLRPFWQAIDNVMENGSYSCPHEIAFEYMKRYLNIYKDHKKFGFLNFCKLTHHDNNKLRMADDNVIDFLNFLENNNYLNKSALFLFGDHGIRGAGFRGTIQGKLEERLPYFSITLPQWFLKKYPKQTSNLKQNTQVLTSHFDFYSTLKHLVNFPTNVDKSNYGKSLFTNIHELNRTCEDIRIAPHWCPCISFQKLAINDPLVYKISVLAVEYLNKLLQHEEIPNQKCSRLLLKQVIRAGKRSVNSKVQKFEKSKKDDRCDSCGVEIDERKVLLYLYEVTFTVLPSYGQFEMTANVVKWSLQEQIKINRGISRTDLYGDQPKCISENYPHLRQICYCKHPWKGSG